MTNGYQLQAQLFRALAHPVRLEILNVLSRREACVCHLKTLLQRPQPYISQQLATLRESGLVVDRREGTLIYYRIADDRVSAWLQLGRDMVRDEQGNPVTFPEISIQALQDCPCPRCSQGREKWQLPGRPPAE